MTHQADGSPRLRGGYLVGLIGDGILQSFTPSMHEAEAAALGLRYEYRLLDLIELGKQAADVGTLLTGARRLGYSAMNITHPCKQLVVDVVDRLDARAEHLGAVNLVVFEDDGMTGYNTDWMGFRDGLATGLPGASFERVVQLGCGGAGAATAYALLTCGAVTLDLFDVDDARSENLAQRMRAHFPTQTIGSVSSDSVAAAIARASGVVHATPLGMLHHPGVAFDVDLLRADAWVSEVVYRPLETQLLRRAAERGHPVLDGGRMAVGQAYASLQIITGEQPDRARMEKHFRSLIRIEENALRVVRE
jgi:shikimate dehydrogenase